MSRLLKTAKIILLGVIVLLLVALGAALDRM
jgi:hypothetical protein